MGQSLTGLFVHLVFSTKHRLPHITPDLRERLYPYLGGIIASTHASLLQAGGMPDHVHLLIRYHATTATSDLLRVVKTNSSKWVHETFAAHADFAWQTGYGAFTVSQANVERVRAYIMRQEEHHRAKSFQEEFLEFLAAHELEYDPKYVWE